MTRPARVEICGRNNAVSSGGGGSGGWRIGSGRVPQCSRVAKSEIGLPVPRRRVVPVERAGRPYRPDPLRDRFVWRSGCGGRRQTDRFRCRLGRIGRRRIGQRRCLWFFRRRGRFDCLGRGRSGGLDCLLQGQQHRCGGGDRQFRSRAGRGRRRYGAGRGCRRGRTSGSRGRWCGRRGRICRRRRPHGNRGGAIGIADLAQGDEIAGCRSAPVSGQAWPARPAPEWRSESVRRCRLRSIGRRRCCRASERHR